MPKSTVRPRRVASLISRKLDDELVVIDQDRDEPRAHCLSPLAVAVWEACDGNRDIDAVASEAERALDRKFEQGTIDLVLGELQVNSLLDGYESEAVDNDRRDLLKQMALAAGLALPLVQTIVLPTPAAAGTAANCQTYNQLHICAGYTFCNATASAPYTVTFSCNLTTLGNNSVWKCCTQ